MMTQPLAVPPVTTNVWLAPARVGVVGLRDRVRPAEGWINLDSDMARAIVGEEIILDSDVQKLVAVRYLRPAPGESESAYSDRILEELITDALRERELRKAGGLEPEPAEVEARLKALAARVEAERGQPFEEVLKGAGITRGEAAAYVRRGLMLETFARERLTPSIRVTDAEIRAFYDGPFRDEARRKGLKTLPPLSEVVDEVRDLLREQKLNEAIARWTDELRKSMRILIYRR
jgi:hypothetical protein